MTLSPLPDSRTNMPKELNEKWKQMQVSIEAEHKYALRRVTITDEAQGIIRGYGFIWGSPEHRDSYQTWFDKEAPPEAGLDFVPKMLMYEHGFDGGIKKDIIGRVVLC